MDITSYLERHKIAFAVGLLTLAFLCAIELMVTKGRGGPITDITWVLVIFVVALIIYFFPSAVALQCKHKNILSVFLLNIFLGWTFLGWVFALVWASMSSQRFK
jgi:hypothetical protein